MPNPPNLGSGRFFEWHRRSWSSLSPISKSLRAIIEPLSTNIREALRSSSVRWQSGFNFEEQNASASLLWTSSTPNKSILSSVQRFPYSYAAIPVVAVIRTTCPFHFAYCCKSFKVYILAVPAVPCKKNHFPFELVVEFQGSQRSHVSITWSNTAFS